MQKLCRLLAQVPSLEITGFIPYPSNLLQNPSKPHPANTATLWGTHLLNLLLSGKMGDVRAERSYSLPLAGSVPLRQNHRI